MNHNDPLVYKSEKIDLMCIKMRELKKTRPRVDKDTMNPGGITAPRVKTWNKNEPPGGGAAPALLYSMNLTHGSDEPYDHWISDMIFSADSKRLAVGRRDSTLRLYSGFSEVSLQVL